MKVLHLSMALVAVALLFGCKGRGVDLPTASVSGRVTYQGKPLGFGKIIFFHPSSNAKGADIAADGTFSLIAYQGENCIAVECFDADKPGSKRQRSLFPGVDRSLIPERYMSYGASGLTCEVKPGDDNKVQFDLKD